MSDQPQHSQGDAQERDVEQIISQESGKSDPPVQEEFSADETSPTPEQKAKGKAAPREKKNKRSATYIYLLILFGAAFMMLLLAYFVQQRNSESTISDLRNSMNLSRDGLMEEIQSLEDEISALQQERSALNTQLDELQEQYDDAASFSAKQEKDLQCWIDFWALEADFLAEDYESCAQWFKNVDGSTSICIPDEDGAYQRASDIYETLLELEYLTEEDLASNPFATPEPEAP